MESADVPTASAPSLGSGRARHTAVPSEQADPSATAGSATLPRTAVRRAQWGQGQRQEKGQRQCYGGQTTQQQPPCPPTASRTRPQGPRAGCPPSQATRGHGPRRCPCSTRLFPCAPNPKQLQRAKVTPDHQASVGFSFLFLRKRGGLEIF